MKLKPATKTSSLLFEIVEIGVFIILLSFVIHLSIQPVRVDGSSMFPTLHNNDYLMELKLPYYFTSPNRGDIVILKNPENPSENLIKRVVGLPDDRLLISNGKIFINGHLLDEPYLKGYPTWLWLNSWPDSGQPYQLKGSEFFVMGDNRNDSEDSRLFGPVQRNQILGDATLRVLSLDSPFSFSRFGLIGGPPPTLEGR